MIKIFCSYRSFWRCDLTINIGIVKISYTFIVFDNFFIGLEKLLVVEKKITPISSSIVFLRTQKYLLIENCN